MSNETKEEWLARAKKEIAAAINKACAEGAE